MEISEVIVRTVTTFIFLYVIARMVGKKLISQMTFFDFVAGVTFGSIAASVIFSSNISLPVALLGFVIFGGLVFVIDFLTVKSYRARTIFNGKPSVIIRNGSILPKELSRAKLTVDELLHLLRKDNTFYISDVDIAVFETNGTLSVLKKPEKTPVTKQDLNISSPTRGLPQVFIIDGKIMKESLSAIGRDRKWVDAILYERFISSIQDVLVAQIDDQNQIYINTRD